MKGERIPTLEEFLHMCRIMEATHTKFECHALYYMYLHANTTLGKWEITPLQAYVAQAVNTWTRTPNASPSVVAERLRWHYAVYLKPLTEEGMSVKESVQIVFEMLQAREIHPRGTWDNRGVFYAEHKDLINVRTPSKAYPYSELNACRTKKYVTRVAEKFKCANPEELLKHV